MAAASSPSTAHGERSRLTDQLVQVCRVLDQEIGNQRYERCVTGSTAERCAATVARQLGFRLRTATVDGQREVLLHDGAAESGALVAIFPGTAYRPNEPAMSAALANRYVYKCADGVTVDGCDFGMSKLIYKSCTYRSRTGSQLGCDQTWLTTAPVNPLAIGNHVVVVNDHSEANVAFKEMDIPLSTLGPRLRRYLPNVMYGMEDRQVLRVVALVATRPIEAGQPLRVYSEETESAEPSSDAADNKSITIHVQQHSVSTTQPMHMLPNCDS